MILSSFYKYNDFQHQTYNFLLLCLVKQIQDEEAY